MIYVDWKKENKVLVDDSIQFGRGVFETILVKRSPVFLKEHVERINESAKKLFIERSVDINELSTFINDKNIRNCSLKLILTDKNVIIITKEINYTEQDYKNGFKIRLSEINKNSKSILPYIKSINYIENVLERKKAIADGFNEVIFLNENGFLTEGSISNVYIIKDSIIKTPRLSMGLLNGTLRKWVVSNYEVEEGAYTVEDLRNSEGVFITNSLVGVMKVIEFEDKVYCDNTFIKRIAKDYNNYLKNF